MRDITGDTPLLSPPELPGLWRVVVRCDKVQPALHCTIPAQCCQSVLDSHRVNISPEPGIGQLTSRARLPAHQGEESRSEPKKLGSITGSQGSRVRFSWVTDGNQEWHSPSLTSFLPSSTHPVRRRYSYQTRLLLEVYFYWFNVNL